MRVQLHAAQADNAELRGSIRAHAAAMEGLQEAAHRAHAQCKAQQQM